MYFFKDWQKIIFLGKTFKLTIIFFTVSSLHYMYLI